jgi:hypothetical protein
LRGRKRGEAGLAAGTTSAQTVGGRELSPEEPRPAREESTRGRVTSIVRVDVVRPVSVAGAETDTLLAGVGQERLLALPPGLGDLLEAARNHDRAPLR